MRLCHKLTSFTSLIRPRKAQDQTSNHNSKSKAKSQASMIPDSTGQVTQTPFMIMIMKIVRAGGYSRQAEEKNQ